MPIFRRIHGHIVPLRLSEEQKAGVGMVTAGGVAATAAGYLSAGAERDAAIYHNVGRDMTKKWVSTLKDSRQMAAAGKGIYASTLRRAAGQVKGIAAKNLLEAKRASHFAKNVKGTGRIVTASLVAGGIHKLLPEKVKKNPTADAVASVGSGLGAALLIRTSNLTAHPNRMGVFRALRFAAKRITVRGIKL